MIDRAVLNEQKKLYERGKQEAIANVQALGGAIECIDSLLEILKQQEEAIEKLREQQKEEK